MAEMAYCARHKVGYDENLWCPMCMEELYGDMDGDPEERAYYQTVERDLKEETDEQR